MSIRRRYQIGLALACAAVAAGCSPKSDTIWVSGEIEAITVAVGSRIGGRVERIYVDEGDRIEEGGQVLVELESDELRATVQQAQAEHMRAEAELAKLEAGTRPETIAQAEATVAQAEAAYDLALEGARSQEIKAARATMQAARAKRDDAELALTRAKGLYEGGVVAKDQLDQAQNTYDARQNEYEASMEELDALLAGTRNQEIAMKRAALAEARARLEELKNGPRPEDIAAARAQRDGARADVERLKARLDEMTVRAPSPGVIESMDVHPGDLVDAGSFIRMADPDQLKVWVYVSEDMLGLIDAGREVEMKTDSFGDERFTGRIVYISPVGEFTPRNLQTQEDRVRQVYGVKIEMDSHGGKLRAGMTAEVALPRPPITG